MDINSCLWPLHYLHTYLLLWQQDLSSVCPSVRPGPDHGAEASAISSSQRLPIPLQGVFRGTSGPERHRISSVSCVCLSASSWCNTPGTHPRQVSRGASETDASAVFSWREGAPTPSSSQVTELPTQPPCGGNLLAYVRNLVLFIITQSSCPSVRVGVYIDQ